MNKKARKEPAAARNEIEEGATTSSDYQDPASRFAFRQRHARSEITQSMKAVENVRRTMRSPEVIEVIVSFSRTEREESRASHCVMPSKRRRCAVRAQMQTKTAEQEARLS